MRSSPSSSGLLPLPLPGTPASSWALYWARLAAVLGSPHVAVAVAFWLFGLINNVLYVIILSAAQDLVGRLPKSVVLLADVAPSLLVKLAAPYCIHRVPYAVRVPALVLLSAAGMLLVATSPPTAGPAVKLAGTALASISSGVGELSFLGLTHYYGPHSLAAWGSGTGAAGLVGAGLYVVLTDWLSFSVRAALLAAAVLPLVLLVSFFGILPRGALADKGSSRWDGSYDRLEGDDDNDNDRLGEYTPSPERIHLLPDTSVRANVARLRVLLIPYMLPLLLVYVAEYTINQGVAPTLLFPLAQSPFAEHRAFYPFYSFLYQLGVFVARSSTPFYRVRRLYVPALLQAANLAVLTAQAIWFDRFLPSVYLVFAIVLWEGLLGGAVYVNTFASIMERIPHADREFSLGATSASDSAGICLAGLVGMFLEVALCRWQVQHGRSWCQEIAPSGG